MALDKRSGRRVLLVEDEYWIAAEMRAAFEAVGIEVVGPAPTVEAALDLIDRVPALEGATLDLNLRGAMVYPVADALLARGIPFVFATGYDAASIPTKYAGVIRCEKPVETWRVGRALFG